MKLNNIFCDNLPVFVSAVYRQQSYQETNNCDNEILTLRS